MSAHDVRLVASSLLVLASSPMGAQRAEATITWGGFVDSYFAYDFGRLPSLDRSFAGGAVFTTQPARHNEFNVNLAFVDVRLESPQTRGRLALQAGTSVQSNYSSEPTNGTVSGPSLSRLIQEAVAGVKLSDRVWIDAGVFFSHMGLESWISRDNPTYTRSLVAEYSPYYQSGARITYGGGQLTAALNVVNGWQNISENNSDKGVGARIDYAPSPTATLSYYNFFSGEGTAPLLRTFNGVGAKVVRKRLTMLTQLDYGTQERIGGAAASWYGWTAVARAHVNARAAVALRAERFDDADQAIVVTGVGPTSPFRANGASLGFDFAPAAGAVWRSEVRGWLADAAVFPNVGASTKSNVIAVTSLALTF